MIAKAYEPFMNKNVWKEHKLQKKL